MISHIWPIRLELIADFLSFPTSLCFDKDGTAYIAESGLSFNGIHTSGCILRIDKNNARSIVANDLWPPVNGLSFYDNGLYVSEGRFPGRIQRIDFAGQKTVILDNLPGPGNYHTNMIVFGSDDKEYFSQGSMTNTGIVGLDAYDLGWLRRLPHACDIPGDDIVLTGVNVETRNPLSNEKDIQIRTGAFVPFGKETKYGQKITGEIPCTSGVMRRNPDGTNLELVAWGLRNAYGLGFLPDGRLIATDQGADDRGSRPIGNAPDLLFHVRKNAWYGWPDVTQNSDIYNI